MTESFDAMDIAKSDVPFKVQPSCLSPGYWIVAVGGLKVDGPATKYYCTSRLETLQQWREETRDLLAAEGTDA